MRLEHPVFQGPLELDLETTPLRTPAHYREYPAGAELPETLPALVLQERAFPELQPGLVLDPFGFEDSPDCEWISGGTNSKGPTSMALGRQGNLFHWGFFADPRDLTETGRRLFLNCAVYIAGFVDDRPLLQRRAPARERVFLYLHYLGDERNAETVARLFSPQLLERTGSAPARVGAYFRENLEFLHRAEGRFEVDADVARLGLSNRSLAFLEALATRLRSDPEDALATRLVERYVDGSIAPTAQDFPAWLDRVRAELYFSDTGGFRWFSARVPTLSGGERRAEHVTASLSASPSAVSPGGSFELVLRVELEAGWHAYAPGSQGAPALSLELELPESLERVGELRLAPGEVVEDELFGTQEHLMGSFLARQELRLAEGPHEAESLEIHARLRLSVCDDLSCTPPQTLPFEVTLELR